MFDDIVTGSEGQHVRTVLIELDAAKMTERAEQGRVTKALTKNEPDAMVILPATVCEQDGWDRRRGAHEVHDVTISRATKISHTCG